MGFIKLSKKLLDWEWYNDTNVKVLFIHCLLKANWKPGSWHGIPYEAGQFVTSLSTLAKETGQTIRQARDNLDKLKMTGELTSTSLPKGRLITINNWSLYQTSDKVDDKEMTSTLTSKPTSKGATDKEYKEYKEKVYPTDIPKRKAAYYPDDKKLDKAFSDFVEHRKKLRKPLSDKGVELAIKRLEKLSGGNSDKAVEIINQSILGGWQGLFELKDEGKSSKPNKFNDFGQRKYDYSALENQAYGEET